MYQPATARDIEGMKKLVEKSQSKTIKSCLKSNSQRDGATDQSLRHHHHDPCPQRVEFRRTRTEREYEYDRHDKSRKWYNVSRKMAFVGDNMQDQTSARVVVRQRL